MVGNLKIDRKTGCARSHRGYSSGIYIAGQDEKRAEEMARYMTTGWRIDHAVRKATRQQLEDVASILGMEIP